MPATSARRRIDHQARAALAGAVVVVSVFVSDLAVDETVLAAFLLMGPLVAAASASVRQTLVVVAMALTAGVLLGVADDALLTRDYVLRLSLVAAASSLALVLARSRVTRDQQIENVGREVTLARRLGFALDAGRMGIWVWDRIRGRVEWDERVHALFGLPAGAFEGTLGGWIGRVHPDDRRRVRRAIERAVATGEAVRFDQRAVWPDGSVHWLEGRGEAVTDEAGRIVGAIGVCIDIAARRRAESERVRLLQSEREARRSSERAASTLARLQQVTAALSRAVSVQGVADSVVREGTSAVGAEAAHVAFVDEAEEHLVVRAAFGYQEGELEPYRRVPIEPGQPVTFALTSGEPVFVESPAHRHRLFGDHPALHAAFAVVPLVLQDERRGVLVFGFSRARGFAVEERSYIEAIGRLSSQALERAVLYESEQRSRVALRLLLDASERLGALDDPERMIESVARLTASRLGRWAVVDLLDETGGLRRVAVVHARESRSPELERLLGAPSDDAVIRKVVDTGASLVVEPDLPPDEEASAERRRRLLVERFGWRATIVAPMSAGAHTIGALSIGWDRPVLPGSSEVELVEDVARRTASAVQRAVAARAAREAEDRHYQERLAAEHHVVELLQRSILPDVLPEVEGVELAAAYRPVEPEVEIGGDWYDLVPVEGDRLLLVVGDVAGHGLPAAALMGRVRNATRAYAIEDPEPAAVLERLDRLVHVLEPGAMVTAVAALHDPAAGGLRVARAGHLPPLLVAKGKTALLDVPGGPPLGVEPAALPSTSVELPPGAVLLLFSDGLVERRGVPVDEALRRLVDRVAAAARPELADLDDLCAKLAGEVPEANGRRDDVCVVALRRSTARPWGPRRR